MCSTEQDKLPSSSYNTITTASSTTHLKIKETTQLAAKVILNVLNYSRSLQP